jgi:hypothetical protein
MVVTKFWVVLKNGKSKQFKTRKEAMDWEKSQEDYPKGRYHIYNDAPDTFMNPRNKGKSYR